MKTLAMIPARYAATRFPFKLMQPLGTKTVIRHTYDNTVATGLFNDVWVVTDHEIIFNEITDNGGKAIMSKSLHESGSDRIAEAVEDIDVDVIVNVQGDEPFVFKNQLSGLVDVFADERVQVASLMKKISDENLLKDSNTVKVVTAKNGDALYFSRSAIPFARNSNTAHEWFEHTGIYAYRKPALLNFTHWPVCELEKTEMLEQLRYLYHGVPIRMVETIVSTVKIDTPADLPKAEEFLKNYNP